MRVAYVLRIFPKLSETFILSELAELRGRGNDLVILSALPPREEVRHGLFDDAGLGRITVYGEDRFREALRRFRPDLIHAHFATEAAAAARDLASELGIPFTFTAHGYDIFRKPPPDWRARAEAAAATVTVSESNARFIAETYGVPGDRLQVVPPGVDVSRFRPSAGRGEPVDIVCVARLVEVKNVRLLLRACAALRDRGRTLRCIVVGDGPLRSELARLRDRLGLTRSVELVGPATQEQVVHWWQRARLGALTSSNEGFPVSLLEAAACGVPVVATAVGGVPELVVEGATGLLVPPDDAHAFARAVARLLDDAPLAARLGAAARARVEARFSLERQVDRLVAVWVEVAAGVPA